MSGCILRASGETFDVDNFVQSSSLKPCKIFRKGEPRVEGPVVAVPKSDKSGINVVVSNHETLPEQVSDALIFLQQHASDIIHLRTYKGVESINLDFGLWWPDSIARFDHLPAELILLAGELGLSLKISHYRVQDE